MNCLTPPIMHCILSVVGMEKLYRLCLRKFVLYLDIILWVDSFSFHAQSGGTRANLSVTKKLLIYLPNSGRRRDDDRHIVIQRVSQTSETFRGRWSPSTDSCEEFQESGWPGMFQGCCWFPWGLCRVFVSEVTHLTSLSFWCAPYFVFCSPLAESKRLLSKSRRMTPCKSLLITV